MHRNYTDPAVRTRTQNGFNVSFFGPGITNGLGIDQTSKAAAPSTAIDIPAGGGPAGVAIRVVLNVVVFFVFAEAVPKTSARWPPLRRRT